MIKLNKLIFKIMSLFKKNLINKTTQNNDAIINYNNNYFKNKESLILTTNLIQNDIKNEKYYQNNSIGLLKLFFLYINLKLYLNIKLI